MDYKKLDNTSTVDLLGHLYKDYRSKKRKRKDVYEVERLISKREGIEDTEYLVKWNGYSKYESTWEVSDNISEDCIWLFENPQPGKNEVVQAVDSFRIAVEGRLKSKCCLPVTIDFPSHIFKHLFEGKGEFTGVWHDLEERHFDRKYYLEERHFDRKYFPHDWDRCLDSFGEGHKTCFPARMHFFLSWSSKRYLKLQSGEVQPCRRAYQERLSFSSATTPC